MHDVHTITHRGYRALGLVNWCYHSHDSIQIDPCVQRHLRPIVSLLDLRCFHVPRQLFLPALARMDVNVAIHRQEAFSNKLEVEHDQQSATNSRRTSPRDHIKTVKSRKRVPKYMYTCMCSSRSNALHSYTHRVAPRKYNGTRERKEHERYSEIHKQTFRV